MTNLDSEAKNVCGYCGKAKGWHLWGCPKLDEHFRVNFPVVYMTHDEEPGAVKPIDATQVATLPEVE